MFEKGSCIDREDGRGHTEAAPPAHTSRRACAQSYFEIAADDGQIAQVEVSRSMALEPRTAQQLRCSLELVLSHELANILLVHEVVLVLLPVQSGRIEQLVTQASATDVLLNLLIAERESGHLSALPVIPAVVQRVVDRNEEEEAVDDDGPLVHIAPHGRVRSLHHN